MARDKKKKKDDPLKGIHNQATRDMLTQLDNDSKPPKDRSTEKVNREKLKRKYKKKLKGE